ncbi:phosphoribosylglycinamide formyltransferase [Vogesella sp. LYT5W]|uniref:Phosphoribosylglycinamide formyltransferase n=1 Tax=Vogesella margarita TaxID=2984199 RepID=A0ABT5IKB2_9NEIS|nr:phosphoribosylglycinamide formyltransferase [Vogesella margarita]MDC7712987.1 phosphoribosylglycinamide formyltransferase [Vogesella margarita]
MKNIVILISGRGSNMQAIVDADIPGARIAAVIANRPDAAGLAWAAARGIATVGLDHKQFASREAFDESLAAEIDAFQPDLVVLAGFMRILTPAFTARYEGRMLNIHPSLLPSFPGLHTHQRAIDMGCKVAGCTVHFVTAELDHGPIVAQAVVPVLDDDTETTLAARVLQQEHRLYPEAVRRFAAGELQIRNGRIGGVDAAAAGLALQVPVL